MSQGNLFTRNDTIFGVCQGLGEDLGFNPTYLRIALVLPIFWFPLEMLAVYLGLGLVVWASRSLFKSPKAEAQADIAPIAIEQDGKKAAAIDTDGLRKAA